MKGLFIGGRAVWISTQFGVISRSVQSLVSNLMKLSIASLLLLGLLSGCRSSSPEKKTDLEPALGSVYGATFAPLGDMFMLKHGTLDLLYDTASFRNRNGRWPENYTELTNFVNSSGGYLWIGRYKSVDIRSLTNDNLEISYIRPGQTNASKITIGDALHSK